jgi:hypothetical protein
VLLFGGDGDLPPGRVRASGVMPPAVGGVDGVPEVAGPGLVHGGATLPTMRPCAVPSVFTVNETSAPL